MSANKELEEQVWAREVEHWECIKASNLVGLAALWHQTGVAWSNGQSQPHDKDGVVAATAAALDALQPGSVEIELKRLSCRVVGDTGVVFFEMLARATTMAGPSFEIKERITRTWLRYGDAWLIVAAMSAEIIDD